MECSDSTSTSLGFAPPPGIKSSLFFSSLFSHFYPFHLWPMHLCF